jgi:radical SAM protein with 4Fe4S-binding SPASM domain
VSEILIHKYYPQQQYSTLFNPKTGFFLRMEDPGVTSPFWSECGPELLDISITRWCDRNCPQCYRESNISGGHMPIQNYRQILDQAKNLPVNQIALGGGNPNQHPNFCEILRITREEYGIVPSYTTNGRGLTQEILNSSKKYCGAVAVSAYPPYYELEEAIQKLNSNGIKTNIHFVLNKKSILTAIDWLENSASYLSKINAIIFLNYKPLGRIEKNVGLLKESSHIKRFFNEIEKSHKFKIGFDSCCVSGLVNYTNTSPLFFDGCDAGRFSMFISEDMIAYPCSFMTQTHQGYDLKNHNIIDAWKNGKEFIEIRDRKFNNKCGNCPKKEICLGGCPCWDSINLC